MTPVCGTCLYYRSPLTDLMFSFMQTSKSANHMAEAQCRHQLEFKASIRMNMAWLDIRCALEVPGTFQHNHLRGLQRTVWTRERNRRAAVLWEKMCRAWQEGKSDSNNHVLPPKSFSECTSCWKAASDHRAPHRPATNRNLRLQYAQAFCSRLWYKHHNSMDSSCTESVVLQCEGYFHVHAFLTTVYQLLQDDV